MNLKNVNIKRWLASEENVYVGRPNKWGNLFKLSNHSRQEAIYLFKEHIFQNKKLAETVTELRGKILGCWCAPYQCHAEVLHELAGNRPIYQMASTLSETLQFRVTNLGTNVSVEEVLQFLGFVSTDSDRKYCSVALSVKAGQNFAFVMVPQHLAARVQERNGTELNGRLVEIMQMNTNALSNSQPTADNIGPHIDTEGDHSNPNEPNTSSTGYAQAAAPKQNVVLHYVELDATAVSDCYSLPNNAEISLAVRRTFVDIEEDWKIFAPRRNNPGVWRLETSNIDAFKGVSELRISNDGPAVAKVTIKSERLMVKDGKLQRQNIQNPNDLLITLREADSQLFDYVTNEDILKEILNMGIGALKRAPQRQWDKETGGPSGNKYFILENVSPEDRERIPKFFEFRHPEIGTIQMWLSHRFQIRKCWFCGDRHDAVCPTREKMKQLQQERESLKAQNNGALQLKTYTDSTFRYANQVALASDVDAMPGATVGNLLNAIGVDHNNAMVPNVVLVAGANERRSNMLLPDYLYSLKKIRERVIDLTKQKNVAIVPPPQVETEFITPEEEVKLEKFKSHLDELSAAGALIWENPIKCYDEDTGLHPSPEQTASLIKFIHSKTEEVWGKPFMLPSADDDTLKTHTKYHHVHSLYKYGCGACSDKSKNKWFNICNSCKDTAANCAEIQTLSQKMAKEIEDKLNSDMPPLGYDSEDEFKCDECGVFFDEIRELTIHFKSTHPGKTQKFKRGKSNRSLDDKKGRRDDGAPK